MNEEPRNVEQTGDAQSRAHLAEDGVDVTLIRWMLSLTPPERLQVLQQHVRAVMKLRDAATRD